LEDSIPIPSSNGTLLVTLTKGTRVSSFTYSGRVSAKILCIDGKSMLLEMESFLQNQKKKRLDKKKI